MALPDQVQRGHTYADGDVVDAAGLNALVDQAEVLIGLITEQGTAVSATGTDQVLINRGGVLKRANVSTLPGGVTSATLTTDSTTILDVDNPDPGGPVVTMDVSFKNQTAGKVLAGPITGSAAAPTFRVLSPVDMPFATVAITGTNIIDWNLGVMFTKTLAANTTFTFTGASAGQTIRVLLVQDASHTVTWPTVRWPGGTNPVMTTGAGARDLLTFHFIGGLYFGTFEQDFAP